METNLEMFCENSEIERKPVIQGEEVKHEPEQLRKMFIGGLDYSTTDESLKSFYEKWGTVVDVVVLKDPKTRRSRGFGFITYSKSSMVDEAMNNRPHKIDGRQVEPKRAVPRELCSKNEEKVKKLFIGGTGKILTTDDLEEYFGKYGTLIDCAIVVTKDTGQPRGFGFVEYKDVDSADKVILIRDHEIKGRRVEIKKAVARDEINKDGKKVGGEGGGSGNGGNGIGYGGMRNGMGNGGDFRNGPGNFMGWNGQGNNWGMNNSSSFNNQPGPPMGNFRGWNGQGINSRMINPNSWNNQQGPPMRNFGGWNEQGNNCRMNNPNPWNNQQGPPMGNFGGWNGQGNNSGMNNPNSWNNQQGPPVGNWGGNNSWGNDQNGSSRGFNGMNGGNERYGMGNLGGRVGNMGNSVGNMGSGMGGLRNMGGNGGSSNNCGGGGMGGGSGGMGNVGGNGMPNSTYSGGGMGFNNYGGPSGGGGGGGGGGGPMRSNFGSLHNRSAPYPTSGRSNNRGGNEGGGQQFPNYYKEKSSGWQDGNKPNRF